MGDFLSGVLGTNNAVNVNKSNPYDQLQPWQNRAAGLADVLKTQSEGGGPNPAQLQLLQNAQLISQQQATQTAANRAINPALAARVAAQNAANTGQNAASNAGIQQMMQQLQSQQLLGNLVSGQEGAINTASGINAGIAAGNQQQAGKLVGGILNGASSAAAAGAGGGGGGGMAHGGVIYASDGLMVPSSDSFVMPTMGSQFSAPPAAPSLTDSSGSGGGNKSLASGLKSFGSSESSQTDPLGILRGFMALAHSDGGIIPLMQAMGGKVPALLSPGEKYLNPNEAKKVAEGKESVKKAGKVVPGKAKVSGDSPKNDTVPAALEEGGIVIPRSEMDSEKDAKAFVAKHFRESSSHQKDFKEALKRTIAGRKNKNAA